MQRPGSTTAAAAGFAGGVAISVTVIDIDDVSVQDVGGILLPVACATVVALRTLRRWLNQHEQHTRAALFDVDERRRALHTEHARKVADLAAREERVTRQAAQLHVSCAGIARRLDEALGELKEERQHRDRLQVDYDELAADYNALVQQVLQDGASRFARGTWTPALTRSTSPLAGRRAEHGARIPQRRLGPPADATCARDHDHITP